MKNSKLMLTALLAAGLVLSACGGGNRGGKSSSAGEDLGPAKKYTYRTWAESLGTKWDPCTWEKGEDSTILGFVTEGMVGMAPLDTEAGSWQWTYDMAKSVTDVSDANKAELAKYHVSYEEPGEGKKLQGYIYDIELNPNCKWEEKTYNGKKYGGTIINADDYINSMKILLDPARKNYRANLYYSGESAVAGANQYYNNDLEGIYVSENFADKASAEASTKTIYLDAHDFLPKLGADVDDYKDANGNTCPKYVPITDQTVYSLPDDPTDAFTINWCWETFAGAYISLMGLYSFDANWGYGKTYEECVGCYKLDEFKFRYILQTANDIDNFRINLSSSWLLNTELYEDLSSDDETSGKKISTYNTSAETTISYGPYKMVSYQAGKQVKFTQNENWYGWEKKSNGALLSTTNYLVDGKKQPQYQTTDIVIDVMERAVARLAFEKGEINDYQPDGDELFEFNQSSQLYKEDSDYTWSLFFNTNVTQLQALDSSANNNKNSVVVSNDNFRKAMSLAINRAEFCKYTPGYKPAFSLMNTLYYYDFFNNPNSQYRKTDQAMKAIVDLYGVEYGEGKLYPTLADAYNSITGYNLSEARNLFKQACDELSDAGLYNKGDEIKIRIAYKKGALDSTDQAQVAELNKELNAAFEGSGFGAIELIAVGSLEDRHEKVSQSGEYAIGYGAWGGAVLYPFRNLKVYMDPDENKINEAACWDPKTEKLTLNVNGVDVEMTYQAWSGSLMGAGRFANESADVKLSILAALENKFLGFYYRIPLVAETTCSLLGYQQHYYTEDYNVAYGFGGFALQIYDYDDEAWDAYVKSQGGTLNYK